MTLHTVTTPRVDLARNATDVLLESVVKEFGSTRVLHGLDLHIRAGEFVSLLGPSGCGKTTALRLIAGLEDLTSGTIRMNDVDVSDVPTNKRDIGMVFQSYSLFPHLTVQANTEFGLAMRKVPAAEARKRAAESLEMVGLGHLAARYPHELSGGQQQRVALARALVTSPRVLLLDEPLSALDAQVRVQLRVEIRRIQAELGITTVFVTHDQEEALAISDRVAVMNVGRIEQIGTPEELYLTPATPAGGGGGGAGAPGGGGRGRGRGRCGRTCPRAGPRSGGSVCRSSGIIPTATWPCSSVPSTYAWPGRASRPSRPWWRPAPSSARSGEACCGPPTGRC